MPRQIRIGTHKVECRNGSYTTVIKKKGTIKRFTADTLAQLKDDVQQWQEGQIQAKKGTVNDAIKEYIETCETAGRSPATITGYRQLSRNAYQIIGNIKVSALTLSDIQRQVNEYSKNHSVKSVKNAYGLLHKVLSIYRPSFSMSSVILPTGENKLNEDAGIVIPDDNQIIRLLNYCSQKNIEMFKAILIASQCGLRRSELCALTWGDIGSGALTVNKATIKSDTGLHTKAPKSAAGKRTINLPDVVMEALEQFRADNNEHVVNLTPDAITRRWERISEKLGIKGRFHDLRHYHASVMIALGVPELYAMREMGHSTPTMYKKVYAHMFPEKKTEINSALNSHADRLLGSIVTK